MELLILLATRRGQLVTRDEIAATLWSDGVFVDTDRNINSIVRKLRQALHDDPDHPQFVETVVGKGYRFIGALEVTPRQKESSSTCDGPVPTEPSISRDRIFRFGPFELSEREGELRKNGVRLKLQEQPLGMLVEFVANAGKVVSPEELQQKLWPADTFVDFDVGLNAAIRKLRQALNDDTDDPHYIETLAKRGYRFIAPVTISSPLPVPPQVKTQSCEATDQTRRGPGRVDLRWLITSLVAGLVGGALLLTLVFTFDIAGAKEWLLNRTAKSVQVQRITDFVGVKEWPAISPDGKTVAFVAPVNGRKQIWVRLLAGGEPLQLTHDDGDHEQPRWSPDSSSLIYFIPSTSLVEPGTLWELSALGGVARKIASAVSAGDVSHDGRRIATFQLHGADIALVTLSPDGTILREIMRFPMPYGYAMPRWSPDDRWIAYVRSSGYLFDVAIQVIASEGGEPRDVAHGDMLRGFCWLPDSSGLVYSSSAGSTVLYPPIFNLRVVGLTGGGDRQLTFGEVSYVEPDVVAWRVAASRVRIQSDIWRFPVSGSPQQNTKDALRITLQNGQAQTPSVSPDGKEFVYLSDRGGHGNLWVAASDGSKNRQITFERDPAVVTGVPIWSPVGERIVFIVTRQGKTGEWVVSPDGSNLRQLVRLGSGATWSPDGKWLYYAKERCIEKIPVDGGPAIQVRCQDFPAPVSLSPDGSTLYYLNGVENAYGVVEIRKARPENGPSELLARIPGSRLPFNGLVWQEVLSPDGNWLAAPLLDRGTTNLWVMPSNGRPMRQITDFGQRSVLIVRRVAWSPDSRYIYAAVADTDADIVLLDGLLS
jgi:Tol biopolymer transport system component/DNA-binding winged helix-turn-helix (wHTH) protein